jgi:hypothetical protein
MSALLRELRRIFADREFDATDAWRQSHDDPALTAAIDAEVPRARYRSGLYCGEINRRALRMALRRLKGLKARRQEDYWSFRCRGKEP